jgi:ribosomal protein S18 acetylase RimI-like enzyme
MIHLNQQVRRAVMEDHQQIAGLLFHEANIHRHLDWRSPLDWLGAPEYWILEQEGRVLGALACPADPPSVMWIRLFGYCPQCTAPEAWSILWNTACEATYMTGERHVAAIVTKHWFQMLLLSSGFTPQQEIVLLELRKDHYKSPPEPRGTQIRVMVEDDLQTVSMVDFEAFGRFWHNTYDTLRQAFRQAVHATVCEDESGLIGYQISTGNPFGAHLARLAVRPGAQGGGIGTALVNDLIRRLNPHHLNRLTVNTQSDNAASLALYEKIGFLPTGEHFPVMTYPANG